MAEELAFARKASGLVRGLSMWDAFGVGFMNQGLTPSIWVMTSLGVGVYLGGNLIWATIISMILAGIGFPLVWGVLGGSMPRSGGEYIYNSRIIHPIVGIGESFGNAFVWIMWIYVLAPWTADPGMTMMAQFMGWQGLADFATNLWGMFAIATVANIMAFLFVVFGIKWFARIQKIVMLLGIGGCAVLLAAICFYNKADFVAGWNSIAQQYGSVDYAGFLKAANAEAGGAIPNTWNWFDTFGVMVAGSWLFAYSYCITFIAGEVKRPDKTIILSNLFAIIVPGVFMLWAAIGLYHMVAFNFFSATQFVDNAGSDLGGAYTVPWSTSFIGLLAMVNQNKILLFIAVMSFLAFNIWWIALSYLAFPRILFAWGMDRMGPKWFTDINPRFASPVKNHVLCFVLGQIMIAVYIFWQNEAMQGLAVTALEIFSVFGVTAIAALLFPYVKRSKGIWDASPYKTWKLLGIPVVTIGAIVDLIYLGILAYFFFFLPDPDKRLEGFTASTAILIAVLWIAGILWYFFWKQRSKRVGVDVSMTYGELPPE
ncbi:MAG: amino acid permease [Actinobacteria bacterium]|nr:amino acid permease [Actinomycetota bacterium]